jgi:hypothetical protein
MYSERTRILFDQEETLYHVIMEASPAIAEEDGDPKPFIRRQPVAVPSEVKNCLGY